MVGCVLISSFYVNASLVCELGMIYIINNNVNVMSNINNDYYCSVHIVNVHNT